MTKQVDSSDSSDSELVTTTFEVERGKWRRFEVFSQSQHRSRAGQLRELIDRALETHENQPVA